jgi:PleD family two-component response regulator
MSTTVNLESVRIRLLMADSENKHLLASWLSEQYEVEQPSENTLEGSFDLAIFDETTFPQIDSDRLQNRKANEAPVALPYFLVASTRDVQHSEEIWQLVDDVIVTPIEQPVLDARLRSLLETRQLSLTTRKVCGCRFPRPTESTGSRQRTYQSSERNRERREF